MTSGPVLAAAGQPPDLAAGPEIGRVVGIDARALEVALSPEGARTGATVADLVAIPITGGHLVGLVERLAGEPRPTDGGADAPSGREPVVTLGIQPLGAVRAAADGRPGGFQRGASAYPRHGAPCHLIGGARLRAFLSGLGDEVAAAEQLVLGRYAADTDAPVIANGNRFFQRHAAVLGSTGAGKSWSIALMLERASRLPYANMIVFDLHGEYGPLTVPAGDRPPVARGFRIAGPADLDDPADDILHLPYWIFTRDELLTLLLNPQDPDATEQRLRFTEHLQTAKGSFLLETGQEAEALAPMIDAPIPWSLETVIALLQRDNDEKRIRHPNNEVEPGPYYGRMAGLISRIETRAADARFGFMFANPDHIFSPLWLAEMARSLLQAGPVGAGIKVIDLSEVPSGMVPLIIGVIVRLLFDIQFWTDPAGRAPVCLVCDEAHAYIPSVGALGPIHRSALDAFEMVAKEGRKYGVGLLISSQRPTDISHTILSQCNNFVVMRLTNDDDRRVVERLLPETLASVVGVLPSLETGEAVVIGDALLLPTRIRFDVPAAVPASATQPYWTHWSRRPPSPEAIDAGAEALQRQHR